MVIEKVDCMAQTDEMEEQKPEIIEQITEIIVPNPEMEEQI